MAWNLAAAGDCPPETEHELLADLAEVLGRPEYGTHSSSLHGDVASADPLHGGEAEPEE
jgi:hypothetical protein